MNYTKTISYVTQILLCSILAIFTVSCAVKHHTKLAASSQSKEPELIPREVLFGNPEKIMARISPDGKMISYMAPYNNVLNVWVRTIGAKDDKVVTKDERSGIRFYFWASDSKHIMYLQDLDGNEQFHLYGVNLEDISSVKDYTPFENVVVWVIGRDKHFPDELIITMNKETQQFHDAYHLDLKTGELVMVAKNPGNIGGFLPDTNMKIRGAQAMTPDGGFDLLVRKDEKSEWEKIMSWDSENAFTSGVLGFTKDGNRVYLMDSRYANAGRLVKMDIKTKKIEAIAADPQYDVTDVMMNPDTYEVQAVTFLKDRKEFVIIDKSIKDDIEAIKELDHGDFSIVDRDNADDTWLIAFEKDDGPLSYYVYERKTKEGTYLFDHRSELNKFKLASMKPISFKSRDGLTIHGYITYPIGKERKNMPMVVDVHGGPYYRDTWGYNSEAQWLANRGYICLQVNYRGSTGYGKDFVNAADKEWGGKMHDDLVDAVKWAIDKGIADPQKVAIYGASYGGYAALVGATFTPDLFCCAVDVCGPSNLITFLKSTPPYWATFLPTLFKRVGNPDTEQDFLKSRSPLSKVDQIKIPMLIGQGANDPRVKQAEAEQIVEAMKAKGIDYEYILYPDEGHGFAKPENRLKFYAAAEKFLAKHLGGRYEEATGDLK
ncbi:S9 family peptidase [bacterium]|nr:S9 family peptidase [bacterium]